MYPQTGLKLPPEPEALRWAQEATTDHLADLNAYGVAFTRIDPTKIYMPEGPEGPYAGMTQHRHGALDKQIGGTHYKDLPIQPVEFIHKNGIGFIAGNVVKYVCRYRAKGGTADLLKAKHYIEMLIEQERQDP